MSTLELPWSYYATIVTFGIFFASLNIYILTVWLAHPLASPWWLLGVAIGLLGLMYSLRMVRVHQRELVEKKAAETSS